MPCHLIPHGAHSSGDPASNRTRRGRRQALGRLAVCLLAGGVARVVGAAAATIEVRPIQMANGTSSTTVKGRIKGENTVDYRLRAKAGQTMSVKLTQALAPWLFGLLVARLGPGAFAITAAAGVLASVALWLLPKRNASAA